ncbi:MAG: tetratricopeptide repeat protein [Leptospiraceae bacterium]|nr:tetratricopeptide repeat protein [Leptospiraceae bacterium]
MSEDFLSNKSNSQNPLVGKFFPRSLFVVLFLSASLTLSAFDVDPVGKSVKEGVERYKSQDFQGSLESFNQAESQAKEDDRLSYNKGTSYYKLNDYKLALKYFEKSALSNDKDLKLRSLYNKGNTYAKLGDKKNAIKSYMDALNTDPEFLPARKNLELLTKKEDPDKKDQKQDQDKKDESEKDDKKEKEQDKKNSTAKNKKDKSGNEKKEEKEETQNKPSESNKQITKEEAERILESAKQSKINRKKMTQRQPERNEVFW